MTMSGWIRIGGRFRRWQLFWQMVVVVGASLLVEPAVALAWDRANTNAMDISLDTVTGETIRLADFRGRVVLVNFWATWCPPCLREIPVFVRAQQRYGGKLVVIGVDYMERPDRKDLSAAMRQLEINYPVVYGDANKAQDLARALGGVPGLPTTIIIDRHGNRVRNYIGELNETLLRQLVDPLLEP
ncbi:MAG: TlpA family protein disulfide reductase [Magnetococcales bacterium]|nr:TlpA family protein disulfide reductase [Magnetococcales bacterium]